MCVRWSRHPFPPRTALLLLLVAAARPVRGDELVADRPGFGESASAVPPGHVQLETGATWTRVDGASTFADGPELLLRVGLAKPVEFRLLAPDWFRLRSGGRTTTGWSDLAVGLKAHLAAGGSDFSLRGTLYLATGDAGLSSDRVDPELALAWSRALSEDWSLGATLGTRRLRFSHETLGSPSVSLGRRLGHQFSTFVEYGAIVGHGEHALHRLDHGYTWARGSRTQLDASVGIALSASAPDFFVEAGFCHLF